MLKRYHPDVNRSADAAQRTLDLNEAYKVLSNPAERARYDHARKQNDEALAARKRERDYAQQRRREHSQQVPPTVAVKTAEPKNGRSGLWFFIAGGLAFILYAVTNPTSSDSGELSETTYDQEVQNLSMMEAPTVDPPKKASLGSEQPPKIEFAMIESTGKKFAQLLLDNGIQGARRYSERCHQSALAKPSWSDFDRCAVFDYAAAHIDEQIAGRLTASKNSYFQFQMSNMQDFYLSGGANAVFLFTRLNDLQKYAEQVAEEAVGSEIAKREVQDQSRRETEALEASKPYDPEALEQTEVDRIFGATNLNNSTNAVQDPAD